ncbi:hypothetical protein IX332_001272 [Porphyromonas levii]|uniref:lipopolysaccharide biosynthesis protein n=1 Tax=Porphyromonas levii TaxID=28114 RepID=UPI001B8A94C2|nr:sugar isomerase [Porphyromonas levii]MBR8729944.1 hypothetical protein [Porphyromonas levii]
MPTGSRTANTLKNSRISLIFYVIVIFLNFFSRKVFIDVLGAEVLGLNTTITNLLGLLNLSELGISSAVAFTLYAPIARNDRKAIQEIVSVQGWLYSIIAIIVIVGSVVMMAFFPMIFAKTGLPLWYAYATFIVFLFSSLLGYFFNYKQVLLSASQKEYLNVISTSAPRLIKTVLQIIALQFLHWGYISWLVIEIGSAVAIMLALNYSVHKNFAWLKASPRVGYRVHHNYSIIITKTKQLFFHKIAGFVLTQTSPLIIFAYANLTLVAIYGNYMLIINGLMMLVNTLFNGVVPIIGNLVLEKDNEKERKVFGEYMVARLFIGAIFVHGLLVGGELFMTIWMGSDMSLPKVSFYLLSAIAYIQFTRPYDTFLYAYGRFEDIWAPIAEGGINLGASVLLGYFFGLNGIFIGILLSLVIVVLGWKPYFLATKGFNSSSFSLLARYYIYTGFFFAVSYITSLVYPLSITIKSNYTLLNWTINMTLHSLIYISIAGVGLYLLDNNMRNFSRRITGIIFQKLKR